MMSVAKSLCEDFDLLLLRSTIVTANTDQMTTLIEFEQLWTTTEMDDKLDTNQPIKCFETSKRTYDNKQT